MRYSFLASEVDERLPAYVAIVVALWDLVVKLRDVQSSGTGGFVIAGGPLLLGIATTFVGPILLILLCVYELKRRQRDGEDARRV